MRKKYNGFIDAGIHGSLALTTLKPRSKQQLLKLIDSKVHGGNFEYRKLDTASETAEQLSRLTHYLAINPTLTLKDYFIYERFFLGEGDEIPISTCMDAWQLLPKKLQREIQDWVNTQSQKVLHKSTELDFYACLDQGFSSAYLDKNRNFLTQSCQNELNEWLKHYSMSGIKVDEKFTSEKVDWLSSSKSPWFAFSKRPNQSKPNMEQPRLKSLTHQLSNKFLEAKIQCSELIESNQHISESLAKAYDDACNALSTDQMNKVKKQCLAKGVKITAVKPGAMTIECLKILRSSGFTAPQIYQWIHEGFPIDQYPHSIWHQHLDKLRLEEKSEVLFTLLKAGYDLSECSFSQPLQNIPLTSIEKAFPNQFHLNDYANYLMLASHHNTSSETELRHLESSLMSINRFPPNAIVAKIRFYSKEMQDQLSVKQFKSHDLLLGLLNPFSSELQLVMKLCKDKALTDKLSDLLNLDFSEDPKAYQDQLSTTLIELFRVIKTESKTSPENYNKLSDIIHRVLSTASQSNRMLRSQISLSEKGLHDAKILLPDILKAIVSDPSTQDLSCTLVSECIIGAIHGNLSVPNITQQLLNLLQQNEQLNEFLWDKNSNKHLTSTHQLLLNCLADYVVTKLTSDEEKLMNELINSHFHVQKIAIQDLIHNLNTLRSPLINSSQLWSLEDLTTLNSSLKDLVQCVLLFYDPEGLLENSYRSQKKIDILTKQVTSSKSTWLAIVIIVIDFISSLLKESIERLVNYFKAKDLIKGSFKKTMDSKTREQLRQTVIHFHENHPEYMLSAIISGAQQWVNATQTEIKDLINTFKETASEQTMEACLVYLTENGISSTQIHLNRSLIQQTMSPAIKQSLESDPKIYDYLFNDVYPYSQNDCMLSIKQTMDENKIKDFSDRFEQLMSTSKHLDPTTIEHIKTIGLKAVTHLTLDPDEIISELQAFINETLINPHTIDHDSSHDKSSIITEALFKFMLQKRLGHTINIIGQNMKTSSKENFKGLVEQSTPLVMSLAKVFNPSHPLTQSTPRKTPAKGG